MEENELERRESKLKEQENQIKRKDHNKTIKPKCNKFQQFRYECEDDQTDDKVLPHDNTIDENKEPSQNNIIQQSPNNNSNENPIDRETPVEKEKWFDRILNPNLKQYAEVQLDESDEIQSIQIVNRAGKERGMYHNWYNVRDLNTREISSINWDAVRKWRPISNSEYVLISTNDMNSEDLLNAKLKELKKWRDNDVYEQITFQRQSYITLRWVNTYNMKNGQKKIKSRLVARGFEENQNFVFTGNDNGQTCFVSQDE